MKIILTLLLTPLFIPYFTLAQSISEKELFNLTYKGTADSYNLNYDSASGNYCYVYMIPNENKSFIISNNSLSDKYDYIVAEDIKFDSKGNYYVITSDYKADYGTNNYFLIVNGNVIRNSNYMESYSSYINKKNEFVFIFKESDSYIIGYYDPVTGFRQSSPFDNIRPVWNYKQTSNQMEGDAEPYKEEDFYHDENGERAFIANANGKTKIIFETSEIATEYSDINESSLTQNKNNELSYIAKKGGRFYELYGNEFVVSGNVEYNKYEIANVPLLFNEMNEPVYIAGDSISENKYNYFLVIGNQIQKTFTDESKMKPSPEFSAGISDVKLSDNGSITYLGVADIIIPGKQINPGDIVYDEYYSNSFFVRDGIAYELGYNINQIKYNDKGEMLYSGYADLNKKESLLMLNYGISKIIINRLKFDGIYEYGFSPLEEIYYVGQMYEDSTAHKEFESSLYLADKLIGQNSYFVYQTEGDNTSILKFDSKNNYAFVTEQRIDSVNSEYVINTNSGRLPFPENVSGSKRFAYISNMMYDDNDKLFFIGDMKVDPVTYEVTKELFLDNKTLGKAYNTIYDMNYDYEKNQITFLGSRGSKIYYVTVQL